MYACLECGFVHEDKLITKRVDTEEKKHYTRMGSFCSSYDFHGYIKIRKCPKCLHENTIESIPD